MSDEISSLYAVVDMSKKKNRSNPKFDTELSDNLVYASVEDKKENAGDIRGVSVELAVQNEPLSKKVSYDQLGDQNTGKKSFFIPPSKEKNAQSIPHCSLPTWLLGILVAIVVFYFFAVVALAAAFAVIAEVRSEITSLEGGLNFRCQQLYKANKVILNDFERKIAKISSRVDKFDQKITETSGVASGIIRLLNTSTSQISLLKGNSNKKIYNVFQNLSELITNLKGVISDKVSNFHDMLNTSYSALANDIKSLHVFDSCETVRMLNFPYFQPGFKIRSSSPNNFTVSNCFTTISTTTCNNVTGKWRRVAYLNVTSSNCPKSLQHDAGESSCKICGAGPKCSSVTYPSGGLSYSQVCGRIDVQYSGTPDGLEVFSSQRLPSISLDDNYVDGVSLTYGTCPRNHIWTFSAKSSNSCTMRCSAWGFVNSDYSCMECINSAFKQETFYRNLTQPTTDDIEMRLCRDQWSSDEDVHITFVELFVSS